ncbi:putative leucine-rich repeat-containing protein DDB_G0290503 [Prorops nasuta]|uniref:putative leucine-rich repeat-containing protein DDB_G0290503 n=1 Tax=Prorops nasuta TaxID=863751 RepID=UPI0034CF3982
MPRFPKDSDDETESKTARRSRTISNLTVAGSPLRRSHRIKQNIDSSPESCISDSSTTQSKRITTRSQKNAERIEMDKNVLTMPSPEVLATSPQKRKRKRNIKASGVESPKVTVVKRLTRAGSESRSPIVIGRVTRNTRSKSVDLENESEPEIKEPIKNTRLYRRASVLPSEPAVAEKDEEISDMTEDIAEIETSFAKNEQKTMETEAKLNSLNIDLKGIEAEEMVDASETNSSRSQGNNIVRDSSSIEEVEPTLNKSKKSIINDVNNQNNLPISEPKDISRSVNEISGNKENQTMNIIQKDSSLTISQISTAAVKKTVEENMILSAVNRTRKYDSIITINDSPMIHTKSKKRLNPKINSIFDETIDLETEEDSSLKGMGKIDESSTSKQDNVELGLNNKAPSESSFDKSLTHNLSKETSSTEGMKIKNKETEDVGTKSNNSSSMANIVLNTEVENSAKEIIEIKEAEKPMDRFESQNHNEAKIKDYFQEEPMEVDEDQNSINASEGLEEDSVDSPQESNCVSSELLTSSHNPKIVVSMFNETAEELGLEIKTTSPSRKHETESSNSSDTRRKDEIGDEIVKHFFKDIIADEWSTNNSNINSSNRSLSMKNLENDTEIDITSTKRTSAHSDKPNKESSDYESEDTVDLKYQEYNNENDEKNEELRENDFNSDTNKNGNSDITTEEEISPFTISEQNKLLNSKVDVSEKQKRIKKRSNKSDSFLITSHNFLGKTNNFSFNAENISNTKNAPEISELLNNNDVLEKSTASTETSPSTISNEHFKSSTEDSVKKLESEPKEEIAISLGKIVSKESTLNSAIKSVKSPEDALNINKDIKSPIKRNKPGLQFKLIDSASSDDEQKEKTDFRKAGLIKKLSLKEKIREKKSFSELLAIVSEDDSSSDEGSIDEDIRNEYNLDGNSNMSHSDDNVMADDCRASESEYSDVNDKGSDLEDFIVDDEEETDDEDEDDDEDNATDKDEDDDEDNAINKDEDDDEDNAIDKNEDDDEDNAIDKDEDDDEGNAIDKNEDDDEDNAIDKDEDDDEDNTKINKMIDEQQNDIHEVIKNDHKSSGEKMNEGEIGYNENLGGVKNTDTDNLDDERVEIRIEDNSSIPREAPSDAKKHIRRMNLNTSTSTPNKDFIGESKEIAYKRFMEDDNKTSVNANASLKDDNQPPQQNATPELNSLRNKTLRTKLIIDNILKKRPKINFNSTYTCEYESPTTKFLKKEKLNESAPSALPSAPSCCKKSGKSFQEEHTGSGNFDKKDLLESSLKTEKNRKSKEQKDNFDIPDTDSNNTDLAMKSTNKSSQSFFEKKVDEQLNSKEIIKKKEKQISGLLSKFTEESAVEEKCEAAANIIGNGVKINSADLSLNNSKKEQSCLKSKKQMQFNMDKISENILEMNNSKKLNNNTQEKVNQLLELNTRDENTNEFKKKKKGKKHSKESMENKTVHSVSCFVEDETSECLEISSKKKKNKKKNYNILEEESYVIYSEISQSSKDDKGKRKKRRNEQDIDETKEILKHRSNLEISGSSKNKKQQVEENPMIYDSKQIVKKRIDSENSQLLKKNKNKGKQVKEEENDKSMKVDTEMRSQEIKLKGKKRNKGEVAEEANAKPQLENKTETNSSQNKLKEKKKNKKKEELSVKVIEDDEVSGNVSFSETRLAVQKTLKDTLDAIKAKKEQKKKELQRYAEEEVKSKKASTSEFPLGAKRIKRLPETVLEELSDAPIHPTKKQKKSKESEHIIPIAITSVAAKGIKRLPDTILEELSCAPIRPLKRQKRKKEPEQIMHTSTMFTFNVFKDCKFKVKNCDFIHPSKSGSVTEFKASPVKVKTCLPKKAAIASSFRNNMLSRNSRHPMSMHLMHLQKQKASSKSKIY